MTDAERPRAQGLDTGKKIKVLTPVEITALLNATTGQKWRTLFQLAIFSGGRQGELLGLKWSDIDWDTSQINIQRTFNNGAWYSPKTATSRRKIDIGPSTLTALRQWRLASPPNDLDLVFPNETRGGLLIGGNLRVRVFYPILKRAGISHAGSMTFATPMQV